MATKTILFADNAPEFLKIRREFLETEGYRVVSASNPTEARQLFEQGWIDLAVLDIRLLNDDDEKDLSGLLLAKEVARHIPKIMLTGYPSVDVVREALKPQLEGLPASVEFVAKEEGPEALIQAINDILKPPK